jgi:hypothetical protein
MHTNLAAWANFYLVTASAAAALTGLQFIVQTLMASESLRLLLLPCVGIHNSWDTVTYMTIMSLRDNAPDAATDDGPADA